MAGQQKTVGKQACPTYKSPLGGYPREVGKVIAFRKMPENDVRSLAIVAGLEKIGSRLIGEMTDARENALFH